MSKCALQKKIVSCKAGKRWSFPLVFHPHQEALHGATINSSSTRLLGSFHWYNEKEQRRQSPWCNPIELSKKTNKVLLTRSKSLTMKNSALNPTHPYLPKLQSSQHIRKKISVNVIQSLFNVEFENLCYCTLQSPVLHLLVTAVVHDLMTLQKIVLSCKNIYANDCLRYHPNDFSAIYKSTIRLMGVKSLSSFLNHFLGTRKIIMVSRPFNFPVLFPLTVSQLCCQNTIVKPSRPGLFSP